MRLFGYWRSSSSWRVRIALAYKNIDFELEPVHLLRQGGAQHEPAFRGRNLMSQVPVLELWPTTEEEPPSELWRLTQSMAILEYLEETYPHPPLLPSDVVGRARARQLAEIVNSGIQP